MGANRIAQYSFDRFAIFCPTCSDFQLLTPISSVGPEAFLSGGLSKLGALLATQPLNVIKSRLQEQRNHTPDSHAKYNGVVDCVRRIWRYILDTNIQSFVALA
jgi:hypothetical protein